MKRVKKGRKTPLRKLKGEGFSVGRQVVHEVQSGGQQNAPQAAKIRTLA